MAWCPKCKNEYRDGITVCADCGCELVSEEQYLLQQETEAKEAEADAQGTEADADSDVQMPEEVWEQTAEEAEAAVPAVYFNNKERAEENRSSAWILFIVGTGGLVLMILGMLNVIPLHLGNPYMFYGVMCAVFLLFIVMGVVSMKNARIFAGKAESENTLRDTMTKWYQENLKAASIDAELGASEDISAEVLYFKRVQILKDKFNCQFMNLDQAFLEHYIDDEVYDAVFSEKE